MTRPPGLSVRLKLTLSYAGFLVIAGTMLLTAVWVFLLRGRSMLYLPSLSDFRRAFDPTNYGPAVFVPAAMLALTFLLFFGLVGGWILAGRMLTPLTRITDATRIAADGSLSYRIRLPGRKDEFRELADSFDAMLAELEAHVAEQQRFAANASHELRTPLAITQTLLDVARDDPRHDSRELVDRLRVVNSRAIKLTEALLLLSRADQRSFVREEVDLSLLAEEASETLLPLAEKRGTTLQTFADYATTVGSHALLLQLTTNLVHNAIIHNLDAHGEVIVRTSTAAREAIIAVENTGAQLSPGLVATLAEPFHRGSERIHSDHAGVGLGLSIVRSIVKAHKGILTLTPRSGGGLIVTVRLPAASSKTHLMGKSK